MIETRTNRPDKILCYGKVLTRFVSTFALRSGAADIEIKVPGHIQGLLSNIVLRRAGDGA